MPDRGSTRRGVRIVVVGGGRKGAAGRLDDADRVVPLHVDDIARAHLLALVRLASGDEAERFPVFNLGSGRGCSVREVIDAIGEVARPPPTGEERAAPPRRRRRNRGR